MAPALRQPGFLGRSERLNSRVPSASRPSLLCWLFVAPLLAGCFSGDSPTPRPPRVDVGRTTDVGSPEQGPASPQPARTPTYELPKTYEAGVRRVVELRDRLRAGWRGDEHDEVHEPLHELGPLLRELPKLLDGEDLPEAERAKRVRAIHALYEMFGLIDSKLHSGFGATYDDLEEEIDRRVGDLRSEI